MKRIFFISFSLLLAGLMIVSVDANAQRRKKHKEPEISIYDIDTLKAPIPLQRQYLHDRIEKALRGADASDGAVDRTIEFGDTTFTAMLTKAMLQDMPHLAIMVENLPMTDKVNENQTKIRYLTAILNLLTDYNRDYKVDPYFYRRAVTALRAMIIAREEGRLPEYVKENATLATLASASLLEGYPESRAYLYTTLGRQYPQLMIGRLKEFANEPFAEAIISAAARVTPTDIYNYASSTNYTLSKAIRRTPDSLVQTIVLIADQSKSPLKALPFLSDIYYKRKTIAEVDKIVNDPDLFFKNLVRLKIEGDSMGGKSISSELAYRAMRYVRTINDLHESPAAVRFRIINDLTAPELYYIMVFGQDEIYTSSFLGAFNLFKSRLEKGISGTQLLDTIHYDRFRTFIRMCAGYNTLSAFMSTIDSSKRPELMRTFVSNLEQGNEDDLEDAVDVADAYSSIKDEKLAAFLRQEVKNNYERVGQARNKKGIIIYGLLSAIFNSFATGDVVGQDLGLPPVNLVSYHSLLNDSGVVVEQFFFYGDEDGKMSYNSFLSNFPSSKWSQSTNKYWTTFTSKTGKPVVVYANLPLTEPADEEAQAKLQEHLENNNIRPTIIVHRGHSYHLPSTIERLNRNTRVVMLGSCGGYHNLGTVLDHSPDAQIISSKQIGAMAVNEPIIKAINDDLLAGKDIDWPSLWHNVQGTLRQPALTTFSEYVPPHKNLGAIFIKAYRRLANAEQS